MSDSWVAVSNRINAAPAMTNQEELLHDLIQAADACDEEAAAFLKMFATWAGYLVA